LAFTEVEEPWTLLGKEAVTDDELRRYLCEPGLDYSLDAIVGRFKEISVEGNDRIFMSPEGILGKIIWPLRHSKASYALGNYLGAIALCGMVAEMAALLCFESFVEHSGIRSKRSKPAPKFKKHFEPKKFERYRQTERIKALDEMGLVPAEAKAWFPRSSRHQEPPSSPDVSKRWRRGKRCGECLSGCGESRQVRSRARYCRGRQAGA
jgi:hypothetical protein